jgi:hypothetical protein
VVKVPKAQNTVITQVLGSKYKVIKWRGKKKDSGILKSPCVQEEPYGYEKEGQEGSKEEEAGGEEEKGSQEEESSEEEKGSQEEESSEEEKSG